MIYFTSDLHFAHPFVAAYRGYIDDDIVRRFKDKETKITYIKALYDSIGPDEFSKRCRTDMHDEKIIKNINAVVGKRDELYILGDISIGSANAMQHALHMLNELYVPRARRHLILGNHENFRLPEGIMMDTASVFSTISTSLIEHIDGNSVVMTHIPDSDWYGGRGIDFYKETVKHRDHIISVQHSENVICLHGHTHSPSVVDSPAGELRDYNVGLDAWNMKPASWDDINALALYGA